MPRSISRLTSYIRFALMDRRQPDVLTLGADHIIYYYYPRNLQDPDRAMGIFGKRMKAVGQK